MSELIDQYAQQSVGLRGRINKLAETSLRSAGIMIIESDKTAVQHVLTGDFQAYPEVKEAYTAIQGLLVTSLNEV
jgi:hypothetical protein